MMTEEKSWYIVIDNRNTNRLAKVLNYYIVYCVCVSLSRNWWISRNYTERRSILMPV